MSPQRTSVAAEGRRMVRDTFSFRVGRRQARSAAQDRRRRLDWPDGARAVLLASLAMWLMLLSAYLIW